jgi:Pectate lyase superfamily protein
MTVAAETPITSAVANGVTTVFPYAYTLLQQADQVVQGTLGGIVTTYTLGVHYTLTGVPGVGGTTTFLVAPANGTVITQYRSSVIARTTDYQDNGDLLADTVNLDFDRLWLLIQEIFNGGKSPPGALHIPPGEVTTTLLPKASDRAGNLAGFDSAGNVVAVIPGPSGTATTLALDLVSTNSAAKAAGQIGFLSSLGYGANTVGKFLRDLTLSAGTALLGWIQAGAGAVVRDAQSKLRESFSAKDFGAIGDGVADDTAAIQACIAALAAAGGGTVLLPRGIYKISGTLNFGDTNNMYLQGEGANATQIVTTLAVSTAIKFGNIGPVGYQGVRKLRINCFNSTACDAIVVNSVNPFWLNEVETDAANIALTLNAGAVQYITNFEFNLSRTAGIKILGFGNDQFFSNGLLSNVGGGEPTVAGIWVVSTGGFWLDSVDCIAQRVGMLIAPQNAQIVSWLFIDKFAADTGSDSGIKFLPAAGGIVKGVTFGDSWTASSTGGHGVEINSSGGVVDGVQFNGHRSFANWKDGYSVLTTNAVNIEFNHCRASGNSVIFTGTNNGLSVAANVTQFKVLGGRYGQESAFANTQGRGIIVQPGASDNYSIIGADVRGNTINSIFDGGSGGNRTIALCLGSPTNTSGTDAVAVGTAAKVVTHNLAFTPTGAEISLTAISSAAVSGINSFWVSGITATTFQVNTNVNVAGTVFSFAWQARTKNA